jgi:transposase
METGETGERRLNHSDGEAERFYRDLQRRQVKVRVGIEATGHARWFERLLAELKFELWIGDPARIKAARVRKQKTDRQDAQLLLRLLIEDRFPQIWVPSPENRDLRQLIWHRHRLVQMRTRAMNQIQAVAMNEGVRRKKTLWSKTGRKQLEALPLAPWATRRRQDLLELVDRWNTTIVELTAAAEQEARKRPEVLRLMTHPGVGPITALAFVLVLGSPDRFGCGHQIGSYLGLIPCEDSSADRQRLGHITKQGSSLLRFYWWRQPRLLSAGTPTGDVASFIWPCVATAASLRLRWHANWPSASTGCGVRDSITHRLFSSVRTRESLDTSMVRSKSPPT